MADEIEVRETPERHRYQAWAGEVVAGYVEYRDTEGVRALLHTQVSEEFEGRGIGSTLVRAVLDDVRARGIRVRVECPFIRGWIRRHPESKDLVAQRHHP
jgi:predicted GNAT family acetyltransferase